MPQISKYSDSELRQLIKDGICPSHFAVYKSILEFVENEMRQGVTKTNAVGNAAENYGMSESSIWTILRDHN